MDTAELFKMSGASAGTIAIVLLLYKLFKSVLGKRFISTCCGKKLEVGIDVRQGLTPREERVEIKINPLVDERATQEQKGDASNPGNLKLRGILSDQRTGVGPDIVDVQDSKHETTVHEENRG